MQSSVLDEEELLSGVVGEYRLDGPTGCTFFCRGDADIYRVRAAGGDSYLKVYRPPHTAAQAEAEARFVADLASRGIPVVPAVPRTDGAYATVIEAPEGRRPALLFEAAPPAAAPVREPAGCARVGAALAGLHDAADAMDGTHALFRHDCDFVRDELTLYAERLLAPEDYAYVESLLGTLRDRIGALPSGPPDFGPCHGDLVPSNMRLGADGRVTFFDFGNACLTWRAWELAVVRLCLRKNDDCWDALLEGYAGVRPLPSAFEEALPLFVLLRRVAWLSGVLASCPLRLGVENFGPKFVDEVLADIRSLAAEI